MSRRQTLLSTALLTTALLGTELFAVHAQIVMPPLLRSAQLKPDVHITDLESTSDAEQDDDEVCHKSPALLPPRVVLLLATICSKCSDPLASD